MAQFLSELDTKKEALNDANRSNVRRWVLDEPLIYQSDLLPFPIYIHKGFSHDFASYWGREGSAGGVVHDFLYSNHILYQAQFSYDGKMGRYLASSDFVANQQIVEGKVKIGKLKADKIFLECMRASGDPPTEWRRLAMYWAVVWGGWIAYWRGGKK